MKKRIRAVLKANGFSAVLVSTALLKWPVSV